MPYITQRGGYVTPRSNSRRNSPIANAVRFARGVYRGYRAVSPYISAARSAYSALNSPVSPTVPSSSSRSRNNKRQRSPGPVLSVKRPKFYPTGSGNRWPGVWKGSHGHGRVVGSRKTKYNRPKRLKRSEKVNMTNGITGRVEVNQQVTDLDAVYVGHTTFPMNSVIEFVGRAVAKAFWAKEGIIVEDLATLGPSVPYIWRITYYASPTATTASTIDSALAVANESFGTASARMVILMRTAIDSFDNLWKWQKIAMVSTPTLSDYRFKHEANPMTSYIHGQLVSSLSMQNATPNAVGGSSTDVNNANPLDCKKYYGNGNGTEMVVRTASLVGPPVYTSFLGDVNNGQIAVVAQSVAASHLDEPPTAKFFHHCKTTGKTVLAPGDIKRSKLYYKMNQSIGSYLSILRGQPATSLQYVNKGNYEFFGFEKVVTTTVAGAPSNVPITIDYEIDLSFSFKADLKNIHPTLPLNFDVITLAPI